MTPFIVTILKQGCPTVDIDAHFLEVVQALTDAQSGTVVVVDKSQKVMGILSERDIVRHLSRQKSIEKSTAKHLMTTNIISADTNVTSSGLMELMVRNKIRHVPIINGDELLGLVSITDVITRLLDKQLKETELMKEWIHS
jgi:CBS domain-containing protein